MNKRNVIAVLGSVVLLGGGWYALRTAQSLADAQAGTGQPSAPTPSAGASTGPALQYDRLAPGDQTSNSWSGVSGGYPTGTANGAAIAPSPAPAPRVDAVTGASGHSSRNAPPSGTFVSTGTANSGTTAQTPPAVQGVTGASGSESHEHGEDHEAYEHAGYHESEHGDD